MFKLFFHNSIIYSISTGTGAGNGTDTRVFVLYYYLLLPIITSLRYIRSVDTSKNESSHILITYEQHLLIAQLVERWTVE